MSDNIQPAFDVDVLADRVVEALKAKGVDAGWLKPGQESQKADDAADKQEQYRKNFLRYLQTGIKAALEVGTPSEGGYLIPELYANEIVKPLTEMSILRAAGARVLQVNGAKAFNVPSMTHTTRAVVTDEEGQYAEREPTFGQIVFNPFKFTALAKISEEFMDDSPFNVMTEVINPSFADQFILAENEDFTVGNGSATTQGIVTGATVGKTTAAADAITSDEIIDLYHALGYLYRQNAVWMMNDATAAYVRKLIDGAGNYIWQPGLQAGQPDRLLGRPVYTLNTMATIAATAKVMLFGDLRYYWISDFNRGGVFMQRLNELYSEYGQIGFRAFKRSDANVVLPAAIQVMQMHA